MRKIFERRKKMDKSSEQQTRQPTNPYEKEQQMISFAMDCAEAQLRNGTASSQVVTHFLKLGSERERLERARLECQIEESKAKVEAYDTARNIETLYKDALDAMRNYSGQGGGPDDDYY